MRTVAVLFIAVFLFPGLATAEILYPGQTGESLIQSLRRDFTPTNRLSYREARQEMFSRIDNDGGSVTLVYTGQPFATTGIPDHNEVNTEHTWAQSKFRGANGPNDMKTDLHHLFPTYNRVNSDRGNKPFGDISDGTTERWWISNRPESSIPSQDLRDNYSESIDSLFEPRESHKGNVARAMFYFYVTYGNRNIDKSWFESQLPTLLIWDEFDPIDDKERERSRKVAEAQGNENPFVLDSSLVQRVFRPSDSDTNEESLAEMAFEDGPDNLRSAIRGSILRRGSLQSEFSAEEKTWIQDNCQFGMPKHDGLGPIEVIVRKGWIAGHSAESKIPYWVCEHSTADELSGPGDRDDSSFSPDPKLQGKPRAELSDYSGSGYDRGHMHPAANAKKSQKMMDETHYLSNISPQYGPTFNRGIWRKLETQIREWTKDRGETWIITGPMFYDPLEEDDSTADGLVPYFTIGDGEVAVPTHFFKVILAKNDDGKWEAISFVFENKRYGAPYRLPLYRATVDWIEERTGLDLFPELSGQPSLLSLLNELEGQKADMWETN